MEGGSPEMFFILLTNNLQTPIMFVKRWISLLTRHIDYAIRVRVIVRLIVYIINTLRPYQTNTWCPRVSWPDLIVYILAYIA